MGRAHNLTGGGGQIHGSPIQVQVNEGQSIRPGDFVSFTPVAPTSPTAFTLPDGVTLPGSGYSKTVLFDTDLALTVYAKTTDSYTLHARVYRLMPDGTTVLVTPETVVKTVSTSYRMTVLALLQKSDDSPVFIVGWNGNNGSGNKVSGILTLSYSGGAVSVQYSYDITGQSNPNMALLEKVAENKYVILIRTNSTGSFAYCAGHILTDTGSTFTLGSGQYIGAGGSISGSYAFMVSNRQGVFVYNTNSSSWAQFLPFTVNESVTGITAGTKADGTSVLSSMPLSHLVLSENEVVIYGESSLLVITTIGNSLSLGIKTALGSFSYSEAALLPVENLGKYFIAVYRKASTDTDMNAAMCEVNSSVVTIRAPVIIGTTPQLASIEPVRRANKPTDKFTYRARPGEMDMYFMRSVVSSLAAAITRKGTLPHGISKGSGEAGQTIAVIVPDVA